MKRLLIISWLTALCFLLLGNVHAWEIPSYIRLDSGTRMWFTVLGGDLVQADRTKIDLGNNLGVKKDQLAWEFCLSARFDNIHVLRFRAEPSTEYEQSKNDSLHAVSDYRLGYDLDFYMTPQVLFGTNVDFDFPTVRTRVRNVNLGLITYDYDDNKTRFVPTVGLHGTFYPIVGGISLRPNISARVNWINYEGLEAWDWEAATSVDVPVNRLWTWNVTGGYRYSHLKFKSDIDTVDMNRMGFFIESGVLF